MVEVWGEFAMRFSGKNPPEQPPAPPAKSLICPPATFRTSQLFRSAM